MRAVCVMKVSEMMWNAYSLAYEMVWFSFGTETKISISIVSSSVRSHGDTRDAGDTSGMKKTVISLEISLYCREAERGFQTRLRCKSH